MTGAALGEDVCATDGCSIPTYAVPLRALALGFARLATGAGLAPRRAAAAKRIFAAAAANPAMVAGEGRFDTEVMRLFGPRVFVKTGAEGVYCAALPELGLGLAVKADDGATRAAQAMIATLIRRFLPVDGTIAPASGPSPRRSCATGTGSRSEACGRDGSRVGPARVAHGGPEWRPARSARRFRASRSIAIAANCAAT